MNFLTFRCLFFFVLLSISPQFELRYFQHASVIPVSKKWLPQNPSYINEWLECLLQVATSGENLMELQELKTNILKKAHPIIKELKEFLINNSIISMYVQKALAECKSLKTIDDLLIILNHMLTIAPSYNDDPNKIIPIPIALAIGQFVSTPSGRILFQHIQMAEAMKKYLNIYNEFLSSQQSWDQVKDGWLSEGGRKLMKLDDYIIPEEGFKSWNEYFCRKVKSIARPIADINNNKTIVFPCDGVLYDIKQNVQETSQFWIKSQPYCLRSILNNNEEMINQFIGGDIVQIFLDPFNYHRWHTPVSGTVINVEQVGGLYFSLLEWEGFGNFSEWTGSLPYMSMVNRRGVVYIQNEQIGLVAFLPIGMCEVSSIIFGVKECDNLNKGDELGYFQYGGSTALLLFQKNAIKEYFIQPNCDPNQAPSVRVGQKLALAN